MVFRSPREAFESNASAAERAGGTGESKPAAGPQKPPQTGRLPTVLGMRHLVVFLVLIVLTVSDMTGLQSGGPAVFFYWVLSLLTFLVPGAFVTQWLARRFSGQGACYLWLTDILGTKWGFFAAFCLWLPGLLTVITQIESGLPFLRYLAPTWFTTSIQQGFAIVLILLVATVITCIPLTLLKNLLLGIAALYLLVWFALGLVGGWWLWSGHAPAVQLDASSLWQSTRLSLWQFNERNTSSVIGIVVTALLGVNVPLFLSGELRGGQAGARRASSYVWWGGALTFVAFVAGTFGIMVIVPASDAGLTGAGIEAFSIAFGSPVGSAATIVLALSQVGITVTYLLVFSRLLLVLANNGHLPVALTRTNRHGVPLLSIAVQAVFVAGVTVLIFIVVPGFLSLLGSAPALASQINEVLDAAASVIWVFATALLFLFVLWLLARHKRQPLLSARERLLLSGLSLVGITASALAIWGTVSDSPVDTITDERWSQLVLWTTLVALLLGWISSEIPRMHALLVEQRRVNEREAVLRGQLEESYTQQQALLSEVDQLYREQAKAAVTDPITGLPNHRAVMSRIEEELSRCQRTYSSCAVVFVDLDHFKRVNDTWGHRAGDGVLREVGQRLRAALRLEDFVGRYGGEEFALVLTDADLNGASQMAERLREALAAAPCMWQAEEAQPAVSIAITASIGVAVYQLHGVTREALLEAADQAMYQAKQAGRNRVCLAAMDTEQAAVQAMFSAVSGEQTTQKVERVAVQALTAAAHAHDRGTSAHAQRMMRLAEATARRLGRPEEELHLMRLGALLHDIGKIGIPEAILQKPGPLTEEEWAVMRHHPDIGFQILEQLGGIFQCLSQIVVAHHERWDGTGYPNGLAKEAIPMSARILAVVDSYDAMTSDRPYRKAMSTSEARAELQRCSGRQYDPVVVETLLHVLDEEEITGEAILLANETKSPTGRGQAIAPTMPTQEPVRPLRPW